MRSQAANICFWLVIPIIRISLRPFSLFNLISGSSSGTGSGGGGGGGAAGGTVRLLCPASLEGTIKFEIVTHKRIDRMNELLECGTESTYFECSQPTKIRKRNRVRTRRRWMRDEGWAQRQRVEGNTGGKLFRFWCMLLTVSTQFASSTWWWFVVFEVKLARTEADACCSALPTTRSSSNSTSFGLK